jgi:RNA 2',3'-cyclic 3'-phosphodiesterase
VSEDRLRLFVAVSIPIHLLEALAGATQDLHQTVPGGRWSPPENQHVTLKFLGLSPAERFEEIAAVVGSVSAGHPPAALRLAGLGSWPSRRRVRVLWVGLHDESELLAGLAAELDEALGPLGFEPEKRDFTPHLTLARWRTPVQLRIPLPDLPPDLRESFTVDAVELFRSHLSPKGARYEVLKSWPLTGGAQ